MGAYLSAPVTDKFSSDVANELMSVGSSSMQGWRRSQEVSLFYFPHLPLSLGRELAKEATTKTSLAMWARFGAINCFCFFCIFANISFRISSGFSLLSSCFFVVLLLSRRSSASADDTTNFRMNLLICLNNDYQVLCWLCTFIVDTFLFILCFCKFSLKHFQHFFEWKMKCVKSSCVHS